MRDARARMLATEELDPSLWPDVASTTPATIMLYGKCLTLPPRGTLMSVPGPWIGGRAEGGDGREVC